MGQSSHWYIKSETYIHWIKNNNKKKKEKNFVYLCVNLKKCESRQGLPKLFQFANCLYIQKMGAAIRVLQPLRWSFCNLSDNYESDFTALSDSKSDYYSMSFWAYYNRKKLRF